MPAARRTPAPNSTMMTTMMTRTTSSRGNRPNTGPPLGRRRLPRRRDLRPQILDGACVVLTAENRRTRDEGIRARLGNAGTILNLHPTVDFQPDIALGCGDPSPRFRQFRQDFRNEFLAAESRIHRH